MMPTLGTRGTSPSGMMETCVLSFVVAPSRTSGSRGGTGCWPAPLTGASAIAIETMHWNVRIVDLPGSAEQACQTGRFPWRHRYRKREQRGVELLATA